MNIHFSSRIKRLWLIICGNVLITFFTFASYGGDDPIWSKPAIEEIPLSCMANAYYDRGGKGLKPVDGETLNCTANDVEITNVVVTGVKTDINDQYTRGDTFTCNKDKIFFVEAEVTVRTNADTRYDTSFYLPLNNRSPQVYQDDDTKEDDNTCSLIVPNPEAENLKPDDDTPLGDPIDGPLAPPNDDGDECADIDKSSLANDDYTMEMAEFAMLCQAPEGSTKVVFEYCAAWSVKDRKDCTGDSAPFGQIPSQTSKCNCGGFEINVFISPEAPELSKARTPDFYFEPGNRDTGNKDTFTYTVTIDKESDDDDVYVSQLWDVIYTNQDTDPMPVPNGDFYQKIDLLDPATDIGHTADKFDGIVILENKCNDVLDSDGYLRIAPGSNPYTCTVKMQIPDDALPLALQPGKNDEVPNRNKGDNPEEIYFDYFYATYLDKNKDPIDGEKQKCNTNSDLLTNIPDMAVCSNEKSVAIKNLEPEVKIVKEVVIPTVNNNNGLRKVGNDWFINNTEEPVEIKVTVTNPKRLPAPDPGDSKLTIPPNIDAIWASTEDINGSTSFSDNWQLLDSATEPALIFSGTEDLYEDSTFTDCDDIPKIEESDIPILVEGTPNTTPAQTSFTCTYQVDLKNLGTIIIDGEEKPRGLEEGETYYNEVYIEAVDNENRLAFDTDSIKIIRKEPMVSIVKQVALAGLDANGIPEPISAYKNEITADDTNPDPLLEPGGLVIYKFTVTNETEDLTIRVDKIIEDIEDILEEGYVSIDSGANLNTRNDACILDALGDMPSPANWVLAPGDDSETCTLVFNIQGDAGDMVINRAKAEAYLQFNGNDLGSAVQSEYDNAKVTLKNVPPTPNIDFALQATVFLQVQNTSTFDEIHLTELQILSEFIKDGLVIKLDPDNLESDKIQIRNTGGKFGDNESVPACPEPLAGYNPEDDEEKDRYNYTLGLSGEDDDTLQCAFTVVLSLDNTSETPVYNRDRFKTILANAIDSGEGGVRIKFIDDEGSAATALAEATVQTPSDP